MADLSKLSTEELHELRNKAAQPEPVDVSRMTNDELMALREKLAGATPKPISPGQSALQGALQSGSLGFADEAAAGVGALVDKAQAALGQRGDISLSDAYRTHVDVIRRANRAAEAENPKSYLAGEVGGALATAAIPGLNLAKSAGVAKGATLGAIGGIGGSEANLLQDPGVVAVDAALGGAGGAVTQGLLGAVGRRLNPQKLNELANVKTVKAAGAIGSDLKKMTQGEIQQLGQKLHDKGIVRAFSSVEDIADRTAAAKEQAGESIGAALGKVDELVSTMKQRIDAGKVAVASTPEAKAALKNTLDEQFQFNMQKIGDRIENEIIKPRTRPLVGGGHDFEPGLKTELTKLKNLADDYRRFAPTSLTEAGEAKSLAGRKINFQSETVPVQFQKEVYAIIKNELEQVVGKTANLEHALDVSGGRTLGQSDLTGRNISARASYEAGKQDYGLLKKAEDLTNRGLAREQGNRSISLTDYLAAAAAPGGLPSKLATGAVNKTMRKFGDSTAAAIYRRTGSGIGKLPKAIGNNLENIEQAAILTPEAIQAIKRRMGSEQ